MRPFQTNAPEVNFIEVDGQIQKLVDVRVRQIRYAQLRKVGFEANGTVWTRIARRLSALFF